MSACRVPIVAEIGRTVQIAAAPEAEPIETRVAEPIEAHDATTLHVLARPAAVLVIGLTVEIAARAQIALIEQLVPKASAPNSRPARHSPRAQIGGSALHPAASPSGNIKTAPTARHPNHAGQSHLKAAGDQKAGGELRPNCDYRAFHVHSSPFDKPNHAR